MYINYKDELSKLLIEVLDFRSDKSEEIIKSEPDDWYLFKLWCNLRFFKNHSDFVYRISFLEALIPNTSNWDKQRYVKKLLREYSSLEDKFYLLDHFQFSENHIFGLPNSLNSKPRHLMFKEVYSDENFLSERWISEHDPCEIGCNTGQYSSCYCIQWLKEKYDRAESDKEKEILINTYTNQFVEKLYEMRNSLLHHAFPVMVFPSYDSTSKGTDNLIHLVDNYIVNEEKTIKNYWSTLNPIIFDQILCKIAKNFISDKCLSEKGVVQTSFA